MGEIDFIGCLDLSEVFVELEDVLGFYGVYVYGREIVLDLKIGV